MRTKCVFFALCILVIAVTSCKLGKKSGPATNSSTSADTNTVPQVEKVKPAPGTGNVQGKVLYNSKPVENIEVKLCQTFNRFFGGCSGKTFTARTDKDGDYVIANVPPGTYESLLARVFDTESFVFATTGIAGLNAEKYEIAADKTLFIRSTSLFKGDLKLLNPKPGATVGQNVELQWQPYPDAAYYKFSLYAEEHGVVSPYINERAEAASFKLVKPMPKGTYRIEIEAFNGDDRKLSETSNDLKMTVTEGS
ncbi:MAG TPA: carboxypeptidase-like regulatory domain-containing protein [Pyrinomonadaceae bacterium]